MPEPRRIPFTEPAHEPIDRGRVARGPRGAAPPTAPAPARARPAGAARRAADRVRVHRRRARREGPDLLQLLQPPARPASPRASRRCAASLRRRLKRIRRQQRSGRRDGRWLRCERVGRRRRRGRDAGQVAYIDGSTLYVTNAEGNTVKVTTSAASTVTKTVKADVKGIHPGETVIVTGAAGSERRDQRRIDPRRRCEPAVASAALFGGSGDERRATRWRERRASTAGRRRTGSVRQRRLAGRDTSSATRLLLRDRHQAGARSTARSSTKELHASHRQQQTQTRRGRPR